MTVLRMDHVGVVVENLDAATQFFLALGLELAGEGEVQGEWVDRIVGLPGVRSRIVMLRTPDGHGQLELTEFASPASPAGDPQAPANAPGIRHLTFAVDDLDAVVAGLRARDAQLIGEIVRYADSYRLCYLRGPSGIIVELAQPLH